MLLKMMLANVLLCNMLLCVVSQESRDRRSLAFGVFLKNLLQQSADLSNSIPPPTRAPMRPMRTMPPTTTTTTTTTTAAPMGMQPFLAKSFYKVIPGVGRVGFGFGFAGNLGNQPFFYPLDYNDGAETAAPTTMMPSTMPPTTSTTSTTTTEAPPMPPMPPIPQPQPVPPRRKLPQIQRQPPLPPILAQPDNRFIYNYIPAPHYYNTQTPSSRIPNYNEKLPTNFDYDYYDPYTVPAHRGQTPNYIIQPSGPTAPAQGPPPLPKPTPSNVFNQRPQLSENLIYHFAPNHDIYSNFGVPNVDADNVGENEKAANASNTTDDSGDNDDDDVVPSPNDVPNASSKSEEDKNDNDGTEAPTLKQNDANIDYADNGGPVSILLNGQNYRYDFDAQQNEVPYPLKPLAQKPGAYVYTNQPPNGESFSPVNKQTSYASMRFSTPFAEFQTSTINNGDSYNGAQHFERYQRQSTKF